MSIFAEPYVDAMTGELVITVAKKLMKKDELFGVLAKDIYLTDSEMILQLLELNFSNSRVVR